MRVGDTVEWTSLDPSINHTVTFGTEPDDPRPPSANVQPTSDGARQAVIGSPADNVNSGFLSPAPQDRANLAQSPPGVTRFRVTFTSPGTFNYICAIHDELGMMDTVICSLIRRLPMKSRLFGIVLYSRVFGARAAGRRATRTEAASSHRPCRNRDLFSPIPPVRRLISGAAPRGPSRSSFSATPIAPISVRCTWRILAWL